MPSLLDQHLAGHRARVAAVAAAVALLLIALPSPVKAEDRPESGSITRFRDQNGPAFANGGGDRFDPLAASPSGAAAGARDRAPEACARSYHSALKRIEGREFTAIETARRTTVAGDPRLPGRLFIPPRPGPRSREEMAALAAASRVALSRGRAVSTGDADRTWLADRLRVDLSNYLGQGPSPFLCGGVPAYVDTLRRFADRVEPGVWRRALVRRTQAEAARRSVGVALTAMKPVPPPHFAPTDRPVLATDDLLTGGISGLRPAAGVSRDDAAPAAAPAVAQSVSAAVDPDLPPLRPEPPLPLETVPDLVAAIDRLLANVKANGFLAEAPNQMAIGGHSGLSPLGYPVLARIAAARAYVLGERPLIKDDAVRAALATALADIEGLDYLLRAEAKPGDAVGAAIHATLDAILEAHKAECACRP